MKKIILLFALFISLAATAQANYPGKRPELLVNKELKILPKPSYDKGGYDHFYSKPTLSISDIYKNDGLYKTKRDALTNRVFKVINVEPARNGDFVVSLEDTSTKEIIYYAYGKDTHLDFEEFEVIGGLQIPEGFYCDYVTEKTSNGETVFTTEDRINPGIEIYKTKKGAVEKYFLKISETDYGTKEIFVKRGITLDLKGNKVIARPKLLLSTKHDGNGYSAYIATIELTKEEVALLTQNNLLAKHKMGNLDGLFFNFELELIAGVFGCLQKK